MCTVALGMRFQVQWLSQLECYPFVLYSLLLDIMFLKLLCVTRYVTAYVLYFSILISLFFLLSSVPQCIVIESQVS